MQLKKALLFIPMMLMTSSTLFSCNQKDPNTIYLKVLNSEDYIADGIISDFEKKETEKMGKKVKVIYETFDTMENMFNTLKTGKTKYDLVCASDYMVQKLVNQNLLEPIEYDERLSNYNEHASPFIRERLKEITWGDNKRLDDYCLGYMWGSLGIMYNPNFSLLKARGLSETKVIEDMESYNSLWDSHYQKVISIKDSMRDTYAVGLIHLYQDELEGKSIEERQEIFDRGGEHDAKAKEHINEIKKDLLKLRNNIFGFEVDSGKEDIVTEKIGVDTAWSGDAVKAIVTAEKDKNLKLYYSIPKEGSNLWFDCWTIQRGAKKDVAYDFLNYLSDPSVAKENVEAIGYTSAIAGDTLFEYYNDLYKASATEEVYEYDLSYFFAGTENEGEYKIQANSKYIGRQLSAQFPTKEEADSLMVMKDYGKNNDLILKMWEEVKHESLPVWAITLFVIEIALVATGITIVITLRVKNKNRRKERRIRTAK